MITRGQGRKTFIDESKRTVRYDVTFVKGEKQKTDLSLSNISPSESIGVGFEPIQFSALATPLYEDWVPQANGQTGSSIIPQLA